MRKPEMDAETPAEKLLSFLKVEDAEIPDMHLREMHDEVRLLGVRPSELCTDLRARLSEVLQEAKGGLLDLPPDKTPNDSKAKLENVSDDRFGEIRRSFLRNFLRESFQKIFRVRLPGAIIGALGLCILIFLSSDSLNFRFPQWRMMLEPLKDLSLAATAALTVVLIDQFITIRKVASEVTREVECRMVDMMEMFIRGSKDTGLVRVHKRLDFSKLFENLGAEDELLWLDTYCPLNSEFIDKIPPALERGAKIKMLIIDPSCANAESRANEIFEPDTFTQEVEIFAKRISAIKRAAVTRNFSENCQILAYDDLPGIPMYIVTHRGVPVRGCSGFSLAKPSAFFTHLEWSHTEDGVLENMHEYFEQKWQRHFRRRKDFPQSVFGPTRVTEGDFGLRSKQRSS